MMEKREKGLCYSCDEKFHHGHRCKGKMFALLQVEDNEETFPEDPEVLPMEPKSRHLEPIDLDLPEISFHALAGQPTATTLRLKGRLQNVEVQVLVDGGSTHNFVQERLALFPGLQISFASFSGFCRE